MKGVFEGSHLLSGQSRHREHAYLLQLVSDIVINGS